MPFDLKTVLGSNSTGAGLGAGNQLVFPEDLTSHKMCLAIMPYIEFIKGKKGDPVKESYPYPIIYLPLPADFKETYSHKYTEENLLVNLRKGQVGGGADITKDIILGIIGARGGEIGSRVASRLGSGASPLATVKSFLRKGDLPSMENLYDAPNMRSWDFSYKLLPANEKESNDLKDIIVYLKWLSAPKYDIAIDEWPHLFNVAFLSIEDFEQNDFNLQREASDDYINGVTAGQRRSDLTALDKPIAQRPGKWSGSINNIFTFTDMGLHTITWEPSPSGKPLLYDNGFPVESNLSLSFVETRPLDKEGIEAEIGATT